MGLKNDFTTLEQMNADVLSDKGNLMKNEEGQSLTMIRNIIIVIHHKVTTVTTPILIICLLAYQDFT